MERKSIGIENIKHFAGYNNNNENIFFRYLDITLGVVLLVSMLCLLYGTYSQSHHFLILFFILSLVVVIGYWTWYIYVNFVSLDYPVFDDQVKYKTVHKNVTIYGSDLLLRGTVIL